MTLPRRKIEAAMLLATFTVGGCSSAVQQSAGAAGTAVLTPAAQARADSGRPPYTAADVRFMQGMILHHAQALVMAAWAPTRASQRAIKTLAERIDVSQRDEIAFMERWLRDRRQALPETHAAHGMAGHLMPGMLSAEQLAQLEKARGAEFDRLFLTFMIQHHEGALAMISDLFATPGAGQDVYVFRFASDVEADQTAEIDRMRSMLAASQRNQP